jgi:hypothetical protein
LKAGFCFHHQLKKRGGRGEKSYLLGLMVLLASDLDCPGLRLAQPGGIIMYTKKIGVYVLFEGL